ncbi:MAG: hypothetical protein M1269_00475 [Chloroflexi bacterium]|nr:hypothetical protein [Chloroflexota bacterium]
MKRSISIFLLLIGILFSIVASISAEPSSAPAGAADTKMQNYSQQPSNTVQPGTMQQGFGEPGMMQPGVGQPLSQQQGKIQLHLILKGLMILSTEPKLNLTKPQKDKLTPLLEAARHSEEDIENLRKKMKEVLKKSQLQYVQQLKTDGKLIYYSNASAKPGQDPLVEELKTMLRKKAGLQAETEKEKSQVKKGAEVKSK